MISDQMTLVDGAEVVGEYVMLDGEQYFRIANSHLMPDFFMSLVGASDHWMFISSRGALTAGRCDPDTALFPYGSDDQISVAQPSTGPITLVRGKNANGSQYVWAPFSDSRTGIKRNLYKNALGTLLVFEEINEQLGLNFRYRWAFSEKYGFVRSCRLHNVGAQPRQLELLDGIQNVLPSGVSSEFIARFSNLANAYKKGELIPDSGLGLYYLSSVPTDRAEPSEGLKATTVWQTGLDPETILLSTGQLDAFRSGQDVSTEVDARGQQGAFLVTKSVHLKPGEAIDWHIVAELEQDHADVIGLSDWLQATPKPADAVAVDISNCEQDFLKIVSSADGMQCGSNDRRSNRHLSNTVFNVMRGGVPLEDYLVDSDDFRQHVAGFNSDVFQRHHELLERLPSELNASELKTFVEVANDPDLQRLASEYLPLAFSRRHGDPTRPWNRFAIHLRSENGRTNLNYQGNWRDIFQNWEALAVSYPDFTSAMISRFVNATTADGYNPYRVTKGGFEWEEPEPNDPWANIGYWGDHQIIYLLKLLEMNHRIDPQGLGGLLNSRTFVHANVPYRIKNFESVKQDPRDTIEFDSELAETIRERVRETGADGKLLRDRSNQIYHATLLEKILTLALAKLSNFVPDGGIWLNTQRPEWNDANNALVGNGLSMVTACYLHRWFEFLNQWVADSKTNTFEVSVEVADFFGRVSEILDRHGASLGESMSASDREMIVEGLSAAGSGYRTGLYEQGISGETIELSREQCLALFESARQHLEATIRNNRRDDGLYHAYNLLDWRGDGIQIEHLYEMLEGQVAVLSSGLLSAAESVELLDALRQSKLYRANQDSYMLYPDRQLPRFIEKNVVSAELIESSLLLKKLIADGNEAIIRCDVRGGFHFNGSFRNAGDLKNALLALPDEYQASVKDEVSALVAEFEELFGHRQFTGRSGTFFGYEGLGSIYWHMVSKLGLAVAENFFDAIGRGETETASQLREHFRKIRSGIGAEKSPLDYGAFPSDPYSHTPENAGVKQPGMTGQVKEDILSRFMEVGGHVEQGCLNFRFDLFDEDELLNEQRDFTFFDVKGDLQTIKIPAGSFAFTFCQVPVICRLGEVEKITLRKGDDVTEMIDGLRIDYATSRQVFARTHDIKSIHCQFTVSSSRN